MFNVIATKTAAVAGSCVAIFLRFSLLFIAFSFAMFAGAKGKQRDLLLAVYMPTKDSHYFHNICYGAFGYYIRGIWLKRESLTHACMLCVHVSLFVAMCANMNLLPLE